MSNIKENEDFLDYISEGDVIIVHLDESGDVVDVLSTDEKKKVLIVNGVSDDEWGDISGVAIEENEYFSHHFEFHSDNFPTEDEENIGDDEESADLF